MQKQPVDEIFELLMAVSRSRSRGHEKFSFITSAALNFSRNLVRIQARGDSEWLKRRKEQWSVNEGVCCLLVVIQRKADCRLVQKWTWMEKAWFFY
eukprot:238085-Hanusia_phi.AAC.2